MMPSPGQYTLQEITAEDFFTKVKEADRKGELKSWIGYPQNAKIIERFTGVKVPINKATTVIHSGDVLLCMRLKYRTSHKGKVVKSSNFQFFSCKYE